MSAVPASSPALPIPTAEEVERWLNVAKHGTLQEVVMAHAHAPAGIAHCTGRRWPHGGASALHVAVETNDLEVIAWLVTEAGCSVRASDSCRMTPLHYAATVGRVEVVEFLLDKTEAVTDLQDEHYGMLPVHCAAQQGWLDLVELLCARDPSTVFAQGPEGKTVAHYAAARGHLDIVQFVVSEYCGCNVSHPSLLASRCRTVLQEASSAGHLPVVEWLVNFAGANVDSRAHVEDESSNEDSDKFDSDAASMGGDEYLVFYANRTPLMLAACKGHVDVVRFLAGKGADVWFRNNCGLAAIHCAAERGHIPIVKLLITECGVDVDVRSAAEGKTALYFAVDGGRGHLAQWLISEAGANPSIPGPQGNTPLHRACVKINCVELVRWLVGTGLDVNVQNNHGDTPLHLAMRGFEPDIY